MRKTHLNTRFLLVVLALFSVMMTVAPIVSAAEETAAAESPLTPLGINAGLLFVHTFNFLLVAFLLTFLLWRPAVNFLDARAAKIQKGLEDAAQAAKARQNAEQEAEQILAKARAEASKALEEARQRGDDLVKQAQTEARTEADKIKGDARAEAETQRNAELAGLRDKVIDISVAVAGRILGENIDSKKQASLVSDFFSKLPADAKNLAGKVEVISAMPLNDAEQKKAKSTLGVDDVTFSVDPAILGGVIVRSADKVVDGSVKSGLGDLAARLN